MSLPFLRPMGLPRPSTLRHFLSVGNVRAASTTSTTTNPSSSTNPSIPTYPASTTTTKPYRITRTYTNNLPVYLLRKRGGNLHQTRVRRIEGNVDALRGDLERALGGDVAVDEGKASKGTDGKEKGKGEIVTINRVTGHIVVKGHRKAEVEKFLLDLKF